MFNVRLGGLLAVVAAAAPLAAQQAIPAVRPLGKIFSNSREPLSNITAIRQLPDGRVLVNDPTGHRVVMFDPSLSSFVPVADTTSSTSNAYGARQGIIFPFTGDSTLFVDAASLAMIVIAPDGKLGRVMSVPAANDVSAIAGPTYGAAFDGVASIVYKPYPRGANTRTFVIGSVTPLPDSTPLLRANIVTKVVDTVAMLRTTREVSVIASCGDNCTSILNKKQPFTVADDWAMMPNGTIAIVRSGDYHVEWISRDGKHTSSPKVQHEWTRITDSTREFLLDSLRIDDSISRAKAKADTTTKQQNISASIGFGGGTSATPTGGGRPLGFVQPPTTYVDAQDIPDYRPPFFANNQTQVKADPDGNLWVKTVLPVPADGGIVYDIINSKGTLIDRVQIPGGTTLVGFGRSGVVFLVARDGTGTHLAEAHFR